MKIILVGERLVSSSHVKFVGYRSPCAYVAALAELGAFKDQASLRRLQALGLKPDYTMNLLPPTQIQGNWKLDDACEAAKLLVGGLRELNLTPCLLIATGARVCRPLSKALSFAMRPYPKVPGEIVTWDGQAFLTRIPRMNSHNQQWKNATFIQEVRYRLEANMKVYSQIAKVKL